jgi:glycosyltransferase involved in cell wall biosynthesis
VPLTSQPLVSVVTPLYNTEKYLAECIESVLAQTYSNWEYIIVNNCSTDRSLEIAQRYAQKDPRIRIDNNQTFLSMMQNGNAALRKISPTSKYCKVVHADDWLFPECLLRMVEVAEAHPSVAIVGAYRLDDVRVNLDGLPYPSTVVPGREICRLTLLGGPYVFGSPTSLLIRSDCIRARQEFYDEVNFSLHADTAVCYEILQHWDFGFVHQVLTYTRRPSEAASSYANEMNTYAAANLMMLKRYGPIFLTQAEYRECLRQDMRRYYEFLGKSALLLRDRKFWRYHRNTLINLGDSLYAIKLVTVSLLEAVNALFHPIETPKKVLRLVQRKAGL